jgi:hypothetical protein
MHKDLVLSIFEQFVSVIKKLPCNCLDSMDDCHFDYRIRNQMNSRIIDVIYSSVDKCGRRHDSLVSIDYTSICFEDLSTPQWAEYLIKLAKTMLDKICPEDVTIIPLVHKKCRPQPARWTPLPCKNTTIVTRQLKCERPAIEHEVIMEREPECVTICPSTKCVPKEKIIIKYTEEPKYTHHEPEPLSPRRIHHVERKKCTSCH